MAKRVSEDTNSLIGMVGFLESSAKGWPSPTSLGRNRYSGQYPLLTASFWWLIDFDMSMPWAMQVL